MIATTIKNGRCVRLTADYHLDTETVYYEVYCFGFEHSESAAAATTFEFNHFGPAAKVYKSLSNRIEGGNFTDAFLKNLIAGARAMGYKVTEA